MSLKNVFKNVFKMSFAAVLRFAAPIATAKRNISQNAQNVKQLGDGPKK